MTEEYQYVDEQGNPIHQDEQQYAPVFPSQQTKADLLDKIRPDEIVEKIRHKLLGEIEINGKWTVIPSLKKMAISEEGAWTISSLMLSASSQNVSLSKLKDHEIRLRALAISKQSLDSMLKNWKEWNITGKDQFGHIFQIVFTNTLITLKQCQEEGIRKLLKGTTHEQRVVSDRDEPRTKKKWGIF
jgi:hypothetical protein